MPLIVWAVKSLGLVLSSKVNLPQLYSPSSDVEVLANPTAILSTFTDTLLTVVVNPVLPPTKHVTLTSSKE